MAVLKLKSQASYESEGLEVRAKFSLVVRWRDALPRKRLAAELSTYTTPRELMELEAMMERYDDGETAVTGARSSRLRVDRAVTATRRITGRTVGTS
jgi:hypothetical protein